MRAASEASRERSELVTTSTWCCWLASLTASKSQLANPLFSFHLAQVTAQEADETILCDKCESIHHWKCLGMKELPEGDWFCFNCDPNLSEARIQRQQVSGRREHLLKYIY